MNNPENSFSQQRFVEFPPKTITSQMKPTLAEPGFCYRTH